MQLWAILIIAVAVWVAVAAALAVLLGRGVRLADEQREIDLLTRDEEAAPAFGDRAAA